MHLMLISIIIFLILFAIYMHKSFNKYTVYRQKYEYKKMCVYAMDKPVIVDYVSNLKEPQNINMIYVGTRRVRVQRRNK